MKCVEFFNVEILVGAHWVCMNMKTKAKQETLTKVCFNCQHRVVNLFCQFLVSACVNCAAKTNSGMEIDSLKQNLHTV